MQRSDASQRHALHVVRCRPSPADTTVTVFATFFLALSPSILPACHRQPGDTVCRHARGIVSATRYRFRFAFHRRFFHYCGISSLFQRQAFGLPV